MTVELLERDSGQIEVLVDSLEDLVLVRDGLTRLRQQSTDPENTDHIQALREEVVDDITETMTGTLKEQHYFFDEADAALIGTARAVALSERESDAKVLSQTRPSSTGRSTTPRLIPHQRITSFFDPRLDEKPHRWFHR